MSLIAASLYIFSTIEVGDTFSHILPPFVLLGAGIGLTMSPMSTTAMNAVTKTKAGVASGVLSMFRMVGGTFGVAALGALFQNQAKVSLDDSLAGAGISSVQRTDLAHQLTGGIPHVDGVTQAQAAKLSVAGHDAFIYGFSHAMTMSVGVALAGVLLAFLLIREHGDSLDEEAAPASAPAGENGRPEVRRPEPVEELGTPVA